MRYLISFSYDGTDFNGYQSQPHKRTVENCLEEALSKINNKKTKVYASGRTDRGVHAINQTAHFNIEVDINEKKLVKALNTYLPNDIYVKTARAVDDNFNARFDVKKKTYEYVINMGEYNPLERNYVYQYNRKLGIDKINIAIKYLIGEHDFKAFVSGEDKRDSYVREIYEAYIKKDNDKLIFTFVGNGFMKYQVRYMVGTLIRVGNGKIEPEMIDNILKDEKYVKYVTITKPEGLYLKEVIYWFPQKCGIIAN